MSKLALETEQMVKAMGAKTEPKEGTMKGKGKKAKGEKTGRRSREISGKLVSAEVSGKTYVKLEFESGSMMLTPTSNRETNAAAAAKAIRGMIG